MLNNVLEFSVQYFWLLLLLVVILLVIIIFEISVNKSKNEINPKEVVRLMNNNKILILDIRAKQIFEKGYILNSININKDDFLINKKNKKYIKKNIVLVCDNTKKEDIFILSLYKYGFIKVDYLKGGIQSWIDEELPIIVK